MIAKEFNLPIEEVATWSWRKRELYAQALSGFNAYERKLYDQQSDAPAREPGAGRSDIHPALRKYENVAHVQN